MTDMPRTDLQSSLKGGGNNLHTQTLRPIIPHKFRSGWCYAGVFITLTVWLNSTGPVVTGFYI